MPAILLLPILALFALGFRFEWLFYVADVLALLWVLGFFLRGTCRRWYGW